MTFIENLFSVKNKLVVITGASRGIGLSLAKGFFNAGAKVIGCARSTPEETQYFDHYINVDLADKASIDNCIAEIKNKYPFIDTLINSAGTTVGQNDELPEEDYANFETTLNINLKAAYVMIQGLKKVIQDNTGSIINITSIAQEVGMPTNPAYVASKGGLAQMTKGFAYDLAARKIRVNNIAPGYIHTSMTTKSFNNTKLSDIRLRNMLIKRWGEPDDIIGGALYLASDASSYVTGSTIFIDGGWLANGMV